MPDLRPSLVAGIALATATTLATPALADGTLHFYNWSDYIAEDTIPNFEAQTGIDVTYDVYDSNEVLEAKLLAGNTGYDLVVPTGIFMERQVKAGVYQPLDKDKIPNLKTLNPRLMEYLAQLDPGNEHAAIYMWGTTGIGMNVDMVKARLGEDGPLDSYDMFFKPENLAKLADCGVHVLDAPTELLPIALHYLGLDPSSGNREDFRKVEELLMPIRPYITKFHSSEYVNALANGDICLAIGWSGDVLQAADRAAEADNGVTVTYVIPKEGTLLWFDTLAIPTDAPNPDAAHQMINYLLEPEVTASISNYVAYANANDTSKPFLDEEVLNDPRIYPADDVLDRLFPDRASTQAVDRLRTRLWSKFKTGI
ncbi:polyamine ABC transporter substrate-binding protein [Roseospira marina]|uniref:Putrescine-binding periplasmic protein n=1 Tax=Roseospira marina TaxID=140057 RepID=A0A5M6I7Q4_9PROT|nr:polyamine ABC transporter substrate-binding protein [Roseospira marina]KAA5604183.1 polyamine ABC transporter substrate-binding protein [Roseospira marina]MBB4315722.1 putrescine transport system substrate-binding protein [Roseospira marina]MBB5088834.1 putrescine transport system substrate-binding protein [Roseospira marina]